ncbi:atrial natriuretic peptide receptor 1-like, partial [Limulus polyphemus]|uniref:Atrial natriuretic peptide receptor 1-like n=1 Tax=Limulus polyphemus TaxID=6850 RepID=A0ABM1BN50_LIMPO
MAPKLEEIAQSKRVYTFVGIFTEMDGELQYEYHVVKSAVDVAVKKAQTMYPALRFRITSYNSSSRSINAHAVVLAAKEHCSQQVSCFVGPSASPELEPVAKMAASWNTPICTAGGMDVEFLDKRLFSTLLRNGIILSRLVHFVMIYFHVFDWHRIAVLYDDTDRWVFIIIGTGETVREILLAAYDLGMGNGEYAFLSVELFNNKKAFGEFTWYKKDDPRNNEARKMYESLLLVTVRVPTGKKYTQFVQDVIETSKAEFNKPVDESLVNVIVAGFHDCVLMYAAALNKTLEEGGDPRDGYNLIRRMWNNTFKDGLTGDIYINSNGDREADYTLNDLDPSTGEMRPVATYFGAKQMFEKIPGVKIHWPGGWTGPPPDVPRCGFTGDSAQCKQEEPFPVYGYIMIIALVIILIVVSAGLVIYRKVKLESELNSLWWKVRWDEIMFHDGKVKSLASIGGSEDSISIASNRQGAKSQMDGLTNSDAIGIKIGLYK